MNSGIRLGILGGGQLGKMLCLAAHRWDIETWVLDPNPAASCAVIANQFVVGDFNDYETVLNFGKQVDVLTIEIEHVQEEALRLLEGEGVLVYPSSKALSVIKNKGLQKDFLAKHGLPTAPYNRFESEVAIRKAVEEEYLHFPFVQKTETGGYDGRGVSVIRTADELHENLLPGASLVEPLVGIRAEIAIIAARNREGEVKLFPPVEMAFHPTANLVEYLFCPANIPDEVAQTAMILAERTIGAFNVVGLLAIEMFWTEEGGLLINEVAPRPHNSGHHTIDAHITSQFEQHLRAIMGYPLGEATAHSASVMVNLLGDAGYSGPVFYEGIEKVLAIQGAKVHLYGKHETKPFRKMGHITLVAPLLEEARSRVEGIKKSLKIISK
ncbi:MAG: 5-(carboxyamino)imidazole ribonucleotide synthase [Bacteroidetes Order II. Incertae sedis bacterium]|nr:5-(carboxyamino)imidazole ribonucleotide synthase [Bacteroidetes Order II. bacterium]